MESSNNPFQTTDRYYDKHKESRTSIANPKNFSDPERKYNQITGEESKGHPLNGGGINDTYDKHKGSHQ